MKWREFTTGFSKKPPEEQGILDSITDTAKDAYEWARDNTAAQTRLLLGMGTEAFGKALNFLGDEDTLAAKYNPSVASTLRSAGDSANNLARGLLTSAADIAPVADYDSPVGAFANQVTGAVHGGIGRMASMLHLDQTADAGYNAAQKTANTAPVSTDDLVEYFTNPRGFISDTGQLVGSMATIVPFMGLLPEATAARGLAALGGDTLVQGLVNRGMYGLAKFFASSMPRAVQYGLTSAPIEGAMEGGETRRELLNRGASEEEATRESLIAMGKNVPLLVASNTLEGLSFFSPLRAGNKAVQIGGRGLLNSLQQQYEEFVQQGIQNEALGEPSGWLPWNGAPNQYEAAERVRYPSLLMGGAGGAIQAYAGDDRQDNWERGSQEKISVGDYSTRANKSANSLALDNFMQAIGQQESDGNYDLTNPDSGAAGKFQIMPDNWSSWAQDAGLSPDAPMTPENQNLVARNKMQEYFNKFGNWRDVAIAWYDGEGAVDWSEEAKNRPQGEYPSVNEYADSVMARFVSLDNKKSKGQANGIDFATGLQSAKKALDGKQMDNGTVGCVEAVTKILSHVHPEFKKMVEDGVVNTVEGDNSLHSRLEKMGIEIIPFDESKVAQGDIIFYDDKQTYQHVLVADHKDENGQWRVFGNSSSNNRVMEQPLYQGQTPSWIAKVSNLQSSQHSQGQTQQGQPQQKETPEPEPTKPLFDLNAEDSTTQNLLEQFLNERADKAIADNNVQEAEFISGMFDDNSVFQNTQANREALAQRYGDALNTFFQNNLQEQAQTDSPKKESKTETKGKSKKEKPYDRNAAVIGKGREFLDELMKNADATSKENAWKLNSAIQSNDIAAVENILKQNNVAIPEPKQTQTQSSQDPVKGNTSPENVLSQPNKNAKGQEKLIKRASQLVTPKTSRDKKQKIGNAIIQLANQNGISVPAVDFKSLQNGSSKKIKEWQGKLSDVGAFTVQPQQSQTSENAPAEPSLKERLNQFLTNAKTTAENQDLNNRVSQTTSAQADDQALQAQEQSQQKAQEQSQQAGEQAQLGLLQSQTQSVQNQRQQQEAPQSPAQSQTQEQTQETAPPQSQIQTQEQTQPQETAPAQTQPQDNEQATQQPTIQDTTPESVSEQTQSQIQESPTQEQSATESPLQEQPQETQPQQTQEQEQPQEQPQPQEQEKPKPKTLEERLISKANSPISKHRTTRIEHGKAIARLAKKAGVDIPKPVETSLENGNEKAIEEARRIINEQINIQTPQQQETTQPQSNGRRGNTAEVITGSRKPHQIQYRVVEADELNSSHIIDNGGVFANESYPTEFQPRDRTRANMQAHLINMGNNLSPNDLLDARDVNQGAPVIRNDGVVLNGNGRTAAIRYAYENGKGESYKKALIDNAQRLGLNADEVSKMNRPVLVRELANDLTEDDIRDITGTQTGGARMGASEQAQADAKRISNETLGMFPQSDNVDLTKAESADFLRAALNDIATPDELNSLTTNNGQVNQDGINQVKRAIFALAYGDDGLISRMSESTDDNVRGATNALLTAAPSIATVQSGMKNGTLHNYDLSAIANAVKRLAALRDEGKTVSNYLQEQSLFADQADSDETREILTTLDRNKRAPNKIATFLKKIASNIQAQGDPRQGSLFGESEPAPLIDLIRRARQDVEGGGQANLFAQEQKQSEQKTSTKPQQNSTETQGTSATETPKTETQQAQETAPETEQQNSKAESETQTPETQTQETSKHETPAQDTSKPESSQSETSKPQETSNLETSQSETSKPQEESSTESPSQEKSETKQQEPAEERKQSQKNKAKAELEAKVTQISDEETRKKGQRVLDYLNKGILTLREATNMIEELINPTPKRVADAKNFDELAKLFKKKYNTEIELPDQQKPYNKIDFEAFKEFLSGVEQVLDEFPMFADRVHRIIVALTKKKKRYAEYHGAPLRRMHGIQANLKAFLESEIEQTKLKMAQDKEDGWSPVGSFKGLGTHEATHFIGYMIFHKVGIIYSFKEFPHKTLVDLAYASIKKSIKKSLAKSRAEISEYATKKSRETIAEAGADFFANGEQAKPLAKAILNLLKLLARNPAMADERLITSQKNLDGFKGVAKNGFRGALTSGAALKWFSAHRSEGYSQTQVEEALFDIGLADILSNIRKNGGSLQEWENALREHVPDEKIMESSDEWTDARINEAIKVTYAKNALEQVGAKINNGKVSFPDAATKNAAIEALKNWETPDFKLSSTGNSRLDVTDVVAPEELTPQQKLLQSFGEKLGVKTIFVRDTDSTAHGAHAGNISYINVNSEMPIGKVFWHESMHWLKASNPKLYQQLVKAAGITDEQRQAYLEQTERDNLYTDAEIDEEIIADQFEDIAKRNGLLQSIAGKNRGLVERVVQWLKDTKNKFIEFFHNPQGKLTTKQKQALADEFGKIATRLVDPNGERIFRYNRRTHNLETIGGRSMAKTTPLSEVSDIKYTFAGKKAKTANKESLARAKKMDDRGVDRNRIYEATGWFKGKDKKWRFEIPDHREQMHLNNLRGKGRLGKYFHLPDVYDNPELYAAYPKLRTISVIAVDPSDTGLEADLVRGSDAVTIGNKIIFNENRLLFEMEETQKTLVHEIQHKIQDYEKFSSGGNHENIKDILETNKDMIMHAVDKIPDGKKYFDAIFAVKKAMKRGSEQAEVKARKEMTQAKQNLSTKDRKDIETLAERFYKLSNVNTKTKSAKISAYYRLGGEQEARHVEERLDNHEGTPVAHDDDALIVFGGKTYPLHKKNASEKGDGELVEGSIPRSAAAANGTTDTAVKKITAGSDNKGGVSSAANVETNSPKKSIPQGEGEIKYSLGRSDNSSESLTQKIRNAFSSWWKGGAKKNRNREITDLLYRVTGYKVDFGNVKDADKTIIDDVHKVIRAKHAYEWDKLLPQIGGKIAKSLKLNPTEEMSNYIADWCMTGAVGNQSAEAKAFEKAMRNDPVTAGLMLQIRESFQEFNDMTAEQKIGSTIVSRLQGKSPREIARTLWSDKEEEITDDLHPVLRQINDMIAKAEKTSPTLAKLMKEDINPYQMMRLLRGIGGLGNLMIGTEKVKNIEDVRDQFRAIYPRLKFDRLVTLDMIVDMAGGKKHVDGLMKYAVAKLDKEMHEKLREDPDADIRPQFSEAVDDEVIKNGEAQYAEAHRALVTYSNILLCIRHDAGLISDNQFTKAIKGWKNYIPMIRVFEDDKEFTIEDSLKHKTGSQRSSYNALETLTQNTYDILSRAERNKAKQQLAFYARIGEFGDIIQEVETSNPGNNVISFREGGKIKYLKVFDPAVKRAVDNIYSPADTSWIMKFLRATMSIVRNMRTMASPDFSIGNLFRDMQDAYIHNRHADANPLKALLDVFREGFKGFGFKRMFREKSLVPHDTDWAEFNALGGTQSTFVSEDVDQLRRSMNKLTRKTFMESFKEAPLHTVLDRLQWLSEQTEYMTRLNSYKRAKAKLAKQRPNGKATPEEELVEKRLAALEARDASIDFAKAGTSTRKINQLLMFANAQVQDWAKWGVIGRDLAKGGEARKIATQKIGRMILSRMVPVLLLAALNRSDDDRKEKYKKRPDWEKETYWIFGDGVRIPKGQDVAGRFVSALTDEFIDKALDDDPVSGKRLLKVIRDAVPSIIPSLIEPAYEVRMNYSAFRDAPIVPVGQQRLDKAEQYGRYTSSFAKLFSEMTGLTSPRGVDYLISSYLGSTGRFVTQLPDYMFGRGMTLNDVLMVRRFVFDPAENTKTVKEYYEAYDEQYKHYNTYKLRRKWDKNAKPHEDFDPKLFARLKAAQKPLQNISAAENNILRNPKLDWDAKNKKIRELEKKREKICEKVMQRAR